MRDSVDAPELKDFHGRNGFVDGSVDRRTSPHPAGETRASGRDIPLDGIVGSENPAELIRTHVEEARSKMPVILLGDAHTRTALHVVMDALIRDGVPAEFRQVDPTSELDTGELLSNCRYLIVCLLHLGDNGTQLLLPDALSVGVKNRVLQVGFCAETVVRELYKAIHHTPPHQPAK